MEQTWGSRGLSEAGLARGRSRASGRDAKILEDEAREYAAAPGSEELRVWAGTRRGAGGRGRGGWGYGFFGVEAEGWP